MLMTLLIRNPHPKNTLIFKLFDCKRVLLLLSLMLLHLSIAVQAEPTFVLRDFQWQDTRGKLHRLSDYRGQWVVLNYWAPWCPPCLEEMPELVAFADQNQTRKVVVIGVAVQYENETSVLNFAEDMLVSFPIVLSERQKPPVPSVEVLPTTVIYDPSGKPVNVRRGAVSKAWLEQQIKTH